MMSSPNCKILWTWSILSIFYCGYSSNSFAQEMVKIEYHFPFSENATLIDAVDKGKYYLYQGDMKIPKTNEKGIYGGTKWPCGEIPFALDDNLSGIQLYQIAGAIQELNNTTELNIYSRTTETNYILFSSCASCIGYCQSYIGMIGGAQTIDIAPDGCGVGTTMHEILHAAGYLHEQARTDRDNFVQIIWSNISPGFEHNFNIATFSETIGSYDCESIMHYPSWAFAINQNNPTITKINGDIIPFNNQLSAGDINMITAKYTPTTEICDNMDNDCDGQIDEDEVCCPSQIIITNATDPVYESSQSIETLGDVPIVNSQNTEFKSQSVTLKPGMHAQRGSVFKAHVDPCNN